MSPEEQRIKRVANRIKRAVQEIYEDETGREPYMTTEVMGRTRFSISVSHHEAFSLRVAGRITDES